MGLVSLKDRIEKQKEELAQLRREERKERRAASSAIVSKYLDVRGAAEYLSVSVKMIYTLVGDKKSEFPARRIGRLLRFVPSELDEWVKRQ
jgi:excisionase family DNA binding protein